MLVNENRGSYGMFSRAGRNSTEKFHILMKKDEILNGTGRKFKPPDLFSQAKEEAMKYRIDNQDEPQQIFLLEDNLEQKPKAKKSKKKLEKIFQYKKSEVYLENFVDIRNKNKRLNLTPSCTKYDPRNEYIWKKAKHFPTWESSLPKTNTKKPKEAIQPKFYRDTAFKIESKNFVDMSRQIDRKSFIEIKNYNTENNYDENFVFFKDNNIDNKGNINNELNGIGNKTQGRFSNFHSERKSLKSAGVLQRIKKMQLQLDLKKSGMSNNKNVNLSEMDLHIANSQISDNKNINYDNSDNNKDNLFNENADNETAEYFVNSMSDIINKNQSYENSPTRKNIFSMLKNSKNNKANSDFAGNYNNYSNNNNGSSNKSNVIRSSRSANPLTSRRWNKIQAPDFKKIISRETRDKMYDEKKRVMPFSIPPYQKTRPRSIMLVKYDLKAHKPRSSKRPTTTPSIEMNFDPYKLITKVNNHKKPSTPDFRLMSSRPNGSTLPSYMQQLHSRLGTTMVTNKALDMNRFADGKFAQTQTCFWPKKSYNKIVNLNFLSSKKFVENVGLNQENDKAKINQVNDYIQKSMKFYNKNFDDLIKESMLNKFDCITYRHIRKENKLDTGDLDKFLLNFEKIDIYK